MPLPSCELAGIGKSRSIQTQVANNGSGKNFQRVQRAWETLRCPQQRLVYDSSTRFGGRIWKFQLNHPLFKKKTAWFFCVCFSSSSGICIELFWGFETSQILRHRAAQQAAATKQEPKMHWYEDLRAAQKERMRQARWALEFDSKFVGMNSWIPFFFWKRSSGMCVFFVFLLTCKMLVGTVSVFSWWRQKPKILGTVEPFCWKKWATHPGDEWQPKWQDLSRCLSWSSSDASTTIWKGRELNRCEKQLVFLFWHKLRMQFLKFSWLKPEICVKIPWKC